MALPKLTTRRAAMLGVLILAILAGFGIRDAVLRGRMLRADPDLLPANIAVTAFAVPRGAQVYAANCAGCHGATAKGDPVAGVPNLTDDDWLYGSGQVDEIEKIVEFGIRSHNPRAWNLAEMPAFAREHPSASEPRMGPLKPLEIREIIEFLFAVEGRPHEVAASQRGGALYADRGGCYDCHGADVRGDVAIGAPNLSDSIWLYGDGSRASLFDTIAGGRAGVCPAWEGKLSPAAIREVALYVYSLSPHSAALASAR